MEDLMGFFQVRSGFVGRKVNGPLDPIKCESYHVLCASEIPIALGQFLRQDGFLAIRMPCYLRLWEQGMNTMD